MNLYEANNYGMQSALPNNSFSSLGANFNSGINTNVPVSNTSMANITPTLGNSDQGLSPLIYGNSSNQYPSAPNASSGLGENSGGFSLGFDGLGKAFNGLGGLQGITSLVGSIGGIYSGLQQLSMAKKVYKDQKKMAERNYAAGAKVYNTSLNDRITSRYVQEGKSADQAKQYVAENSIATK